MDDMAIEKQLQNALNFREKEQFNALIDQCKNFKLIFKFTIECAKLVPLFERSDLEAMMECGLRKMFFSYNFCIFNAPEIDARQLLFCLRVIEKYKTSSNRQELLKWTHHCSGKSLGYVLWRFCTGAINSGVFPNVTDYIFENHQHFLLLAFTDAHRTNKFSKYFSLVDACIRKKILNDNYIVRRYGEFVSELFHYWRNANDRAISSIITWKRIGKPQKLVPGIQQLIMRMILQPSMQLIENAHINFAHVCDNRSQTRRVFHSACAEGNASLVSLLFTMGVDTESSHMQEAVRLGHAEVVRVLLKNGARIDQAIKDAAKGNAEISELLEQPEKAHVQRRTETATVLGIGKYNRGMFKPHAQNVSRIISHMIINTPPTFK